MIPTLHGQTTLYSNLLSDIAAARQASYQALEIESGKLKRYAASGLSLEALAEACTAQGIEPACIDIIGDVERTTPEGIRSLLDEARELCTYAVLLGCPTIQLNAFCGLAEESWKDIIRITARNIAAVADIGKEYGIRFQYEGAAWTPIHSLSQCLELIDAVQRDNFGLVLDTWHLWAGYDTSPNEIACLDASIIYGVHVSDGLRPEQGESWPNESLLRGFYPGEGDIPLAEWMDAIRATGYDGYCSGEILCPKLWEGEHLDVAVTMKQRMDQFL